MRKQCHVNRQRNHKGIRESIDATSQRMCCCKWSSLWTSYIILKRVPARGRKSISLNLFTFIPMLIGTFLLNWGWRISRNSLWHWFWDILYIFTSCKLLQCVYLQFYGSCLLYYFVAVNYGNLLLQALLEHWWRPPQVDEDTDCQGDQQGTGQTQGGNDYFSVPGHTPVIFRCIFLYTTLCLKGLLTLSKVLVH